MLTANSWISTADKYLLEDLVRFEGMDFPGWIWYGTDGN